MSGTAARWRGGRAVRRAAVACAAVLLTAAAPRGLAAQVGYDPSHSPFHDIPPGAVLVVTGGYLTGSRGRVGVGLSHGPSGGVRYEASLAGAVGVSLGLAYARTNRFVVDPTKDSLTRKTGPFDNSVVLADAALQLVLTGKKTWRGLAPYVGAAIGLAFGGPSPRDTSGYQFGNRLTVAPNAGVRWYPGGRVSVRADVRAVAWKLHYPVSYKQPNLIDGTRVLPLTASLDEWTWHPWITIGVGWTF